MIVDQDTNIVYFAEGLIAQKKYRKFFNRLKALLEKKKVVHGVLPVPDNIWCRDYMPVQVSKNRFVQFRYEPEYDSSSRIPNLKKVYKAVGINPHFSDIKLDGGNIVKSRTSILVTSKVLGDNPDSTEEELKRKLKKLLKTDRIIIVPRCPEDKTGHADGMARFSGRVVRGREELLVSDFDKRKEKASFFNGFFESVETQRSILASRVPYDPYRNSDDWDAKGVYINYLQVGATVIYPTFEIAADKRAHRSFSRIFSANAVPLLFERKIDRKGGVLNCISWNILR